ncbi:GxxExxY protein [Pontiella agarivorans]|uniref:GxxExxY protein n=1 Tax=Pontiella agarivorans TaxID=3038953 RepID=A0ABU5MT78_9BACT|nr:GxxExxY protein [Pontiella agarivorans]MDZ8117400.1 GxxExxY protein [Pontiella agarivorans]
MEHEQLTERIIGAAMKVHSALGPGLLERAYHACLLRELEKQDFSVSSEVMLPLEYEGETIDAGFRMDLLVEDSVIVELKSVEKTLPIHEAQLITYLKLSGKKVGLLINFNVSHLKDGITRRFN